MGNRLEHDSKTFKPSKMNLIKLARQVENASEIIEKLQKIEVELIGLVDDKLVDRNVLEHVQNCIEDIHNEYKDLTIRQTFDTRDFEPIKPLEIIDTFKIR
tara:strand:+ start:4441 stop:4743 length:303 start_codon:yes stop_codon:yes gene_type:complete